jgi:hypothetical protein
MSEADAYTEEMRSSIRRGVAAGFSEHDEIAESAVEYLEGTDGAPANPLKLANELLDEAWADHVAEERTWGAELTDCDRLDRAFEALDHVGIVARQNFTCCQTCGCAEIGDEIEEEAEGYTFYHQQDTDSAVDGQGIWLAFGSFGDTDPRTIARRIVDALEAQGLRVEWNGDPGSRIHVALVWRRRRAH